MKFTLTIDTNNTLITSSNPVNKVRADRRVAKLIRLVSEEIDAGWDGPRDILDESGAVVGKWEYARGVTK